MKDTLSLVAIYKPKHGSDSERVPDRILGDKPNEKKEIHFALNGAFYGEKKSIDDGYETMRPKKTEVKKEHKPASEPKEAQVTTLNLQFEYTPKATAEIAPRCKLSKKNLRRMLLPPLLRRKKIPEIPAKNLV